MMDENGNSDFSQQDVMFAQMMIPHHQQAVDIGTLAETRAENSDVKTLAAEIKSEQGPEISQMKTWIESAGAGMEMDHEMPMSGMLSESDLAALSKATGVNFDRLFLSSMIAHHEGAIQMASMVTTSKNAEARKLGEAIVESQTAQIVYMKELFKSLG